MKTHVYINLYVHIRAILITTCLQMETVQMSPIGKCTKGAQLYCGVSLSNEVE